MEPCIEYAGLLGWSYAGGFGERTEEYSMSPEKGTSIQAQFRRTTILQNYNSDERVGGSTSTTIPQNGNSRCTKYNSAERQFGRTRGRILVSRSDSGSGT